MNKRIQGGASLKQPQKLERSSKAYRSEETLKKLFGFFDVFSFLSPFLNYKHCWTSAYMLKCEMPNPECHYNLFLMTQGINSHLESYGVLS